jgi:hypothetical protein
MGYVLNYLSAGCGAGCCRTELKEFESRARSLGEDIGEFAHAASMSGARSFKIATGKELVNPNSAESLPGTNAVMTQKKRFSI